MLIGLWDWGRAEEHLRSGWRSREVQAPREGETPLKWHLNAYKAGGTDVGLDVYKGAGVKVSEVTHKSAERLGLPRDTTYQIRARGAKTVACFGAKGVNSIHHTAAGGVENGGLPAWERPDVLLSRKDAERLEGFLYAGWCRDLEARKEGPTSSGTMARIEEATEQRRGEPRGTARSLGHQAYADNTTTRTRRSDPLEREDTGLKRTGGLTSRGSGRE
jgi:hypothetical protein